jgi:coenzyme F420-0:L-glutamate ligase/coenzyme F420-1:gamma-L-glutamate ligase
MKKKRLALRDNDIVTIADKVLAVSEGRIVDLGIKPSNEAVSLSKQYGLESGFVQVVLDESDKTYGGVYRAILSVKNGILIANAGVDHKNAPEGKAALWPKNPDSLANEIKKKLEKKTGKKVGVIIVDSRVNPMRRGTVGIAIGSAGIEPVIDCRGNKDLFGKSLKITFINVIDDLASMAHLAMGETTERIPFVLIRNTQVSMSEGATSDYAKISEEDCLIIRGLQR